MAEHNEIGKIGENIAISFLVKHGFSILERNFRTKYGEIDIVAKKDQKIHFVEVKSIKIKDFSYIQNLHVLPSDNFTKEKHRKVVTATSEYLVFKKVSQETAYQIDLACVYVNLVLREGKVTYFENVSLE